MTDRENIREYMKNCTDAQLDGVIETETARIKNSPSKHSAVNKAARIMLDEAKREKERRGLT